MSQSSGEKPSKRDSDAEKPIESDKKVSEDDPRSTSDKPTKVDSQGEPQSSKQSSGKPTKRDSKDEPRTESVISSKHERREEPIPESEKPSKKESEDTLKEESGKPSHKDSKDESPEVSESSSKKGSDVELQPKKMGSTEETQLVTEEKLHPRTNDQFCHQNVTPPQGYGCANHLQQHPSTCFFGTRQCGDGKKKLSPLSKCECVGDPFPVWHCQIEPCPP